MSDSYSRKTFPVYGMQALGYGNAENVLLGLKGVKEAAASYANNTIAVEYDDRLISLNEMTDALVKAGYTVMPDGKAQKAQPAWIESGKSVPGTGSQQKKSAEKDGSVSITLGVKGMSCPGCEAKIERILQKQSGVRQAKASFSTNTVDITYDSGIVGVDAMTSALAKAGYTLQTSKTNTADGEKKFNINQFIGIAIILFAVYFIISKTVGFNFIPTVDKSTGLGVLFLVGLLTSIHCVAMCGGINMSQCISKNATPGKAPVRVMPSILYNSGRVISYTIIGGIVGALGSVISFSGWMRGIVAVLSGIFMVMMGLSMLGIFPWLNRITPRMPKFLRSRAGAAGKGKGPFVVGLLNGLMPCGPLQAMQIYALGTGSFLMGALSMLLFSLGTVPLMFGLGALSLILSHKFTSRMMKVSAALVLLLGLVMMNRGLALSGVNVLPSAGGTAAAAAGSAQVSGGVQSITTELSASGYPEITVQKGVPVKWDMKASANVLNGCNSTILIPKYNIQQKLKPGDNIIEFTPTEAGTIPYSCWMGMITSKINVVDGPVKASATQPASGSASAGGLLSGGGCCAGSSSAVKFAGGKIPTDQIQIARTVNGVQEVTITVNSQGYSPAVAVVQKGVPTKIKFVAEQLSSCNSYVQFPEYNGGLDLSSGQLETPELTPESDFTFQCGMGMLHGYVKVVDDISHVNLDDVKKQVAAWTPPAGSGGCCG